MAVGIEKEPKDLHNIATIADEGENEDSKCIPLENEASEDHTNLAGDDDGIMEARVRGRHRLGHSLGHVDRIMT
ncbi:UNVERIFIED_CONTAM: hypothetical protein Sradi_3808300 [Sesamum radiatum]|uniref:Uncharacterized protein n=1 Tax=Sesamum radiatum TaxID=300843 RepID=A0AAW2Q0M4_SESRA